MVKVRMTTGADKVGEVLFNTGALKQFTSGSQSELEEISRVNDEFIMFKEQNAKQITLLNKRMIFEIQTI